MLFSNQGKKQVVAAFDGGEITSDGGVILLREAARRMDLFSRLADCFWDQRDGRYVRYGLSNLLAQRVTGLAHIPKTGSWGRPYNVIAKVEDQEGKGQDVRFLMTSQDETSPRVIRTVKKKRKQMSGYHASTHRFRFNYLHLLLEGFTYVLVTHIRLKALKGTELAKASIPSA